MEYTTVFEIDHGVSMGFGFKYPDHTKRTEKIEAYSVENAASVAVEMASRFCMEYLSNPDTKEVRVCIREILDSEGRLLDQKSLLPEKYRNSVDENGCFHGYLPSYIKTFIDGLRISKERE